MTIAYVEDELIHTQLDRPSLEPTQPEHLQVSDVGSVLIYGGMLLGWALIIFTYFRLSKTAREAAQHQKLHRLHSHKVPCQYCRYYTGNPYLRCAVHPTTAMTEEAIGCLDYQEHPSKDGEVNP